jgi:hypothetical protein
MHGAVSKLSVTPIAKSLEQVMAAIVRNTLKASNHLRVGLLRRGSTSDGAAGGAGPEAHRVPVVPGRGELVALREPSPIPPGADAVMLGATLPPHFLPENGQGHSRSPSIAVRQWCKSSDQSMDDSYVLIG